MRIIFAIFLLFFRVDVQAKTRDLGNYDGQDADNLSVSELEKRFRPYLEQKINSRRNGKGRGALAASGAGIVRIANHERFLLARAWDQLTPEFRALYKQATDIHPEDYDTFHISHSGKFKIFYSVTGNNSVDLTDAIGIGVSGDPSSWRVRTQGANGVPDYIDEAAFALDSAWSMVINRFGFAEPINAPDPDGGTDHYSVLITYLEDYGATWPYAMRSPSSPGFSSYIEINSDWSGRSWAHLGYNERPIDALRVTCAHEFLHASQYAMVWTNRLDDLSYGWLEGSAVLMEEIAFPDVNDYLQYLTDFFRNPRISLLGNNNVYMNSIILKYLYEKTNPEDSIGFTKAVHENNYAQRNLNFYTNLERASQDHAGKSWAELLNGFHAESYFTGNRSRPGAFVSDAGLMGRWAGPAAASQPQETKLVRSNAMELFRYDPQPDHPDTLILTISGERNASFDGKTWGASALVMENGDSAGIVPIAMNQNGAGRVEIANWKERDGCLLVVSNGSPGSRNVTVRIEGVAEDPPVDTTKTNVPITIAPNTARADGSGTPIRIRGNGGNRITEIKITTQEGKALSYYSENRSTRNTFKMVDGDVNAIEWRHDKRLIPGVYFVMVTTLNPYSGKKNVAKRKVMILP